MDDYSYHKLLLKFKKISKTSRAKKQKKNEEEEIFEENETGMGEDNAMVVFPHCRSTTKEGTSALQSGPTKSDKSIIDSSVSKENNVDDNVMKDLNRNNISAKTSSTNIKNASTSQSFHCKDIDMEHISDETIVVDKADEGMDKVSHDYVSVVNKTTIVVESTDNPSVYSENNNNNESGNNSGEIVVVDVEEDRKETISKDTLTIENPTKMQDFTSNILPSKTNVLKPFTTTTNKNNALEDSNEEMDLEYSGMATANEPVTATNNQSNNLSCRDIFISNIHLAMTNLSARRALQTMSIWEKHPERELMSLCFLCNGNNDMVSHIINSFKRNEKQHLFNDIVRFVCSKKQMNYNMYQQKYSGKVIAAEENEIAESMSWYLLVHLFVNIVSQLNLMRQYCGLDQKKIILYYKLNRI